MIKLAVVFSTVLAAGFLLVAVASYAMPMEYKSWDTTTYCDCAVLPSELGAPCSVCVKTVSRRSQLTAYGFSLQKGFVEFFYFGKQRGDLLRQIPSLASSDWEALIPRARVERLAFPLWAAVGVCALPLLASLVVGFTRSRRNRRGENCCEGCGTIVGFAKDQRCPNCGLPRDFLSAVVLWASDGHSRSALHRGADRHVSPIHSAAVTEVEATAESGISQVANDATQANDEVDTSVDNETTASQS